MMAGTKRHFATASGGSLGILILDLITPPDIIICLLYPALLVVAPLSARQIAILAAVGAGFTILAGFIEPTLGDPSLIWLNRALVVACLAGSAALLCWPRAGSALSTMRRHLAPAPSPITQFFDGLRRMRAPVPAVVPQSTAPRQAPTDDRAGMHFVVGTMTTLVILDMLAGGATASLPELCEAVRVAAPPGLDRDNIAALVEQRLASLHASNAVEPIAAGRWRLVNDACNDNRAAAGVVGPP